MLQMSLSRRKSDLHIRKAAAGEHPFVFPFSQMGQYKPLPVPVQYILAAGTGILHPTARLSRFQQEVHFRIMAQRLKVPHAFHRIFYRLFVYNISGAERDLHSKPLLNPPLQYFRLHFPHQFQL
jgi:hypothetical protein